eukprot:TRINITY_DN10144_c0_g1_i1.p1 TRINITY_DN10144_c0_g1~~TRINITY_DN10144_c0_g1_i1.p1  ORF type:complete len:149 (-),score=28.86 TRINITY_DN10144_c0_g1_i1:4-450(-)
MQAQVLTSLNTSFNTTNNVPAIGETVPSDVPNNPKTITQRPTQAKIRSEGDLIGSDLPIPTRFPPNPPAESLEGIPKTLTQKDDDANATRIDSEYGNGSDWRLIGFYGKKKKKKKKKKNTLEPTTQIQRNESHIKIDTAYGREATTTT